VITLSLNATKEDVHFTKTRMSTWSVRCLRLVPGPAAWELGQLAVLPGPLAR